jgi:hypothetical protein
MMSNEVQNSLVELARESGAVIQIHEFTLPDGGISRGTVTFSMDGLSTFADKVRAEEREACAKICDDVERQQEIDNGAANTGGAAACAASIRDRKE